MTDIEKLEATASQIRDAQSKLADVIARAAQRMERWQDIRDKLENKDIPPELQQVWNDLRDEGDAAKQDMAQFVQQFENDHARFGRDKAKNKP